MNTVKACAGSSAEDDDETAAAVLPEAPELLPTPIFARAWVTASSMPPPEGGGPTGGDASAPLLACAAFVSLLPIS
ncbi:MAG: hypothetical protein V5B39_04425 [Accumulibacter sp.]|uniref:hypothetical protein n=1 Tax=Accumulibacter sp. TaxID=2053492 RepID=UPI002FC37109